MILVDSVIWIDYLNKNQTKHTDELDRLFLKDPQKICLTDLIMTEVLQGSRNDHVYEESKKTLLFFEIFTEYELKTYLQAANIYRLCRSHGYTIRSTIDTIIAAVCIENNLKLFTIDKDFQKIAKVTTLELYKF